MPEGIVVSKDSGFTNEAEVVKKGTFTTTIEDVTVSSEHKFTSATILKKSTPPTEKTPFVCKMPVPEKFEYKPVKITQEFECEYPSTDPNVMRAREPLPFPEKLHDVIAWTDAFVDRIASLTVAQEKQTLKDTAKLTKDLEKLRTVLATTEVALDNSRTDYKAANARIEAVKKELLAAQAESKTKSQTIEDMKALAAKEASEEERLRKQLSQANADLDASELAKKKLMEQFKKADAEAAKKYEKEAKDHFEDHTALEKQGKLLEAEREAKKAAQKELVDVKTKLRTANIEIEAKNKTIGGLRSDLVGLRTQVEDSKKMNNQLQARLTETTTKLTGSEQSLADAKKVIATLGVEALAAKEHIYKIDQELKDANAAIVSIKDQVKTLTTEKDDATATVAKTQTALETATKEIAGLKTDLHTVKTAAEGLSSMLKEAEAKLKADQETFEAKLKIEHDAYIAAAADRDIADNKKRDAIKELLAEEESHKKERLAYIKTGSITPEQMAANEAKTMKLEAELAAAKARLIPTPDPKNINILSVEYGGRSYPRDSNVVKTLHSYAKTGAEFKVENKIFDEGDPWRGWKKTFSITYQLAEGGVPIHLVGHENDMVKFKLSKN